MASEFRRTVRGMRDLVDGEAENLRFIEQRARKISKLYGYNEVITPLIEHYELLAAKLGEENRKRMFVFKDLGGRKVALRPEFTASVARLVATKMQSAPRPLRLFSVGSLYRYDEPQFGRYREFWQANYELFGSNRPEADVEILALTNSLLKEVGLKNYFFKIGHVGILRSVLSYNGIAEEQQNSIMQLLDKKQFDVALETAKNAGSSKSSLNTLETLLNIKGRQPDIVISEIYEAVKSYSKALDAAENLGEIISMLKAGCVDVDLSVEAGFARGLEYYTGMVFEVFVVDMDIAVGGGGRYDKLIGLFGGGQVPAVGVALGVDRLSLALQKQGQKSQRSEENRVLIIAIENSLLGQALKISNMLRERGVVVELETMGRSVSKALSDADRRGITHAVMIGSKEIKDNMVALRFMKERTQEIVPIERLFEKIGQ
ncbi:histidine--tRNA ligase [Candidatus Bathyarchaeota archaeon]|nr:histidine--tRNA ligase [Candidatus Bathyarchaeota archaeon]